MSKQTNRDHLGVYINGERLNHVRFADDIDAISILRNLNKDSKKVGLKIYFSKTKIMTNLVLGESMYIH